MNDEHVSRLQFDLGYLALLTRYDLKRLSRWEARLLPEEVAVLRDLGLDVAEVTRRLRFGRKTVETVFARKPRWTDLYASRFDVTRIRETPDNVRLKGFLFGYPSCCVEAFIRKPYSQNDLSARDREILFHWACRGCKVTSQLVPEYRSIYKECVRLYGGTAPVRPGRIRKEQASLSIDWARALRRGALPATLGLSALLVMPQAGNPRSTQPQYGPDAEPNPHLLPVADDTDEDYLTYAEEMLLGLDPRNPDTDADGELDGLQEAQLVMDLIDSLPWYEPWHDPVPPVVTHKIDHSMCGSVICATCGKSINMGGISIVNPVNGVEARVTFMELHYLEYGSLSYIWTLWPDDPREYRLDLRNFRLAVSAADKSHLICHGPHLDPDADGLDSEEEVVLGTDPNKADTDGDSFKDGPELAARMVDILGGLPREEREDGPYVIENYARGVESCDICGTDLNMGYVQVVNPVEGLSLDMPFMALHFLAHGSHVYRGTLHDGRVLPVLLRTVLRGDGSSHWLEVEDDSDGDGLKDDEEACFSLNPAIKDTDGDGVPDGPGLATMMHQIIDGLPEGPLPDTTYIVHNFTWGVYQCLVCGEDINMGYMDIVNPQAGTSVAVPYYNLHFMQSGSFSTDRPELYPRIDPRRIDEVLGVGSHASAPRVPAALAPMLVYPNPFTKSTAIVCSFTEIEGVELAIYDVAGRQLMDLTPRLSAGTELVWDGKDSGGMRLSPGAYFCKLKVGDVILTRKIVLLE
jgi:hypothetical protein